MKNKIEVCIKCEWKYPRNLLNDMQTSEGVIGPLCAICALDITNQIHGAQREKFDGPIAEHMRQLALKWRKTHSENNPENYRNESN